MAELTDEQIEFLEHHNIPLEKVFDATGMRTKDYKEAMREEDFWVAYGVTPCREEGHTLRTRKGHCIQCDPAKFTYIKKHSDGGLVYVAWSERRGLTKVGVTANTTKRIALLNSEMYGNAWDWRLVDVWECDKPGKVETVVHRELAAHATTGSYLKNGVLTECRELFECASEHAVTIVDRFVNPAPKSNANVVAIPHRKNENRPRMLPTAVALYVVHQGLRLVDREDCPLTVKRARLVRNLAESILSAISHGMRNQLVSVPDECIEAYMELSEIVDSVEC